MVTPDFAKKLADMQDEYGRPIAGVTEALRDLASQVESLQADAERYRWLRDEAQYSEESPVCVNNGNTYGHAQVILSEDELDAEIDAARKQS